MSKKDARELGIKKGLDRLRESGIDAENVSTAAVGALTSHLGKDHDADLAVAFLLGRVADPAAVAALTELERITASKDVKREARRSLFKLAQRGMSIPRAEDAGIAAARPTFKLGPEIEGYMSSVDGAGGRLVWLTRSHPDGGLQLLQGMVSDRTGLERASGALIKRKELREQAESIKKSHGIQMIPVPWEYADRMLYESHEKAKSVGQGATEHFSSLRAAFNPLKPKPAPHPIHGRLRPDGARAEAWRERSRRLLDEPEFRFWILDDDWMQPYLERVEQARESRLVLN
ncbi:MAG: hypothetical protein ACREQP_06815, partial [Candidatus Binatia bacterium]